MILSPKIKHHVHSSKGSAHFTKGFSPGINGFKPNACSSSICPTDLSSSVGALAWSLGGDVESATKVITSGNELAEYWQNIAAKFAGGHD